MESGEKLRKMTETPIPKLVIALGIPTTISMLITNIYNMADSYFVSEISVSAGGATSVVFGIMAIYRHLALCLVTVPAARLVAPLVGITLRKQTHMPPQAFLQGLPVALLL